MYEQQALCTFESAKLTYCGFTNMSFSTGSPTPWSNDGAYTEPYKPRCLEDQTKYYVLIKNSYSRMLVVTSVLRVCRHFRKSDGLNVHGANINNYYVSMYVNIVSETIKQRTYTPPLLACASFGSYRHKRSNNLRKQLKFRHGLTRKISNLHCIKLGAIKVETIHWKHCRNFLRRKQCSTTLCMLLGPKHINTSNNFRGNCGLARTRWAS